MGKGDEYLVRIGERTREGRREGKEKRGRRVRKGIEGGIPRRGT